MTVPQGTSSRSTALSRYLATTCCTSVIAVRDLLSIFKESVVELSTTTDPVSPRSCLIAGLLARLSGPTSIRVKFSLVEPEGVMKLMLCSLSTGSVLEQHRLGRALAELPEPVCRWEEHG